MNPRDVSRDANPSSPVDGDGERGMALLIVLWVIVSAALVVSSFGASVRSGVSFASAEVQSAETEALLDAGVEIAAAHVIDEDKQRQWRPDGKLHTISFAGKKLLITIGDPNGLIDLNKADKSLILGLLKRHASSEAQAIAIRDRILLARGKPKDVKSDVPMDGAENNSGGNEKQQTAQPLPFVDIAQLRGLEDMTTDLYNRISPFVTVYGRDGLVNPRTAPTDVLLSIPDVTEADVTSLQHDLQMADNQPQEKEGAALSNVTQHFGAYLSNKTGPAYTVSVETRGSAEGGTFGQMFVIATGLDPGAPYRLFSKKPLVSLH